MLPNVSGGRVSAGGTDAGAQLPEALHGAFDLLVIRPASVAAGEVLDNATAKPFA